MARAKLYLQSIVIPKGKPRAEAVALATRLSAGRATRTPDVKPNTLRFRLSDPELFAKGTFRTHTLPGGVMLIGARLKPLLRTRELHLTGARFARGDTGKARVTGIARLADRRGHLVVRVRITRADAAYLEAHPQRTFDQVLRRFDPARLSFHAG